MRVKSIEITAQQIAAGIAAMTGDFRMNDIIAALTRAGCPYEAADRAADRLLQKERKLGHIRAVDNRNWEAVL